MSHLSFFTPLAYDWRMALQAIQAYWPIADEVILGLDNECKTWSGNPFEIDLDELDHALRRLLAVRHTAIRLVQGDFHSHPNPKHNEQQERLACTSAALPHGWIVSVDADELILNPQDFRSSLLACAPTTNPHGNFLTVFKAFGDELLVIDPTEGIPLASTKPCETRVTGEPVVMVRTFGVHHAWSRSEEELWQKLTNWGHRDDFDTAAYFAFWKGVTLENYGEVKDFHPICPGLWKRLTRMTLATAGA
jgi:hypothetical protein